jgi:hypothetical protein
MYAFSQSQIRGIPAAPGVIEYPEWIESEEGEYDEGISYEFDCNTC